MSERLVLWQCFGGLRHTYESPKSINPLSAKLIFLSFQNIEMMHVYENDQNFADYMFKCIFFN